MQTPRLIAAILLGRKDSVGILEAAAMRTEVGLLARDPAARGAAFRELLALCAADADLAGIIGQVADAARAHHARLR